MYNQRKMKKQYKENVNWYCWTTPFSGYGIVGLEYMVALDKLTGGKLSVGWQRRDNDTSLEFQTLTPEQKHLVGVKPFEKARIGIIKTTPDLFVENKSDIKIGYTMVENTEVGKKWVDYINGMNACFVPSKFLVKVFKDSGVTVPVYPVKQGINPKNYHYFDRPKRNTFVFGTCGWLDDRKNWKEMVTAFTSEFSTDEPVELWLKNSNNTFGWESPVDPRVKFIDELWSFEQMSQFYKDLDCFMFISRAEGAGMPPREAMATGLPVILTNWSGLADVSDKEYNYPIDPVSIDLQDFRKENSQPGYHAKVDIQEIMYWMRYVYEHQNEAKEKGKKASKWMHKEWLWNVCAREMLDILEKEFNYG